MVKMHILICLLRNYQILLPITIVELNIILLTEHHHPHPQISRNNSKIIFFKFSGLMIVVFLFFEKHFHRIQRNSWLKFYLLLFQSGNFYGSIDIKNFYKVRKPVLLFTCIKFHLGHCIYQTIFFSLILITDQIYASTKFLLTYTVSSYNKLRNIKTRVFKFFRTTRMWGTNTSRSEIMIFFSALLFTRINDTRQFSINSIH